MLVKAYMQIVAKSSGFFLHAIFHIGMHPVGMATLWGLMPADMITSVEKWKSWGGLTHTHVHTCPHKHSLSRRTDRQTGSLTERRKTDMKWAQGKLRGGQPRHDGWIIDGAIASVWMLLSCWQAFLLLNWLHHPPGWTQTHASVHNEDSTLWNVVLLHRTGMER